MLLSPALVPLCRRLGPALAAARFFESAVADRTGDAYGCLSRGEPGPVEAAAAGPAPLDVLIRLFLAAAPVARPGRRCARPGHRRRGDRGGAARTRPRRP
nr:hypothetical protein [Tsukamurella sp. PLM1]